MTPRLSGRRWQAIRDAVLVRDAGVCALCGHAGADSADHIVPLKLGGTNGPNNLQAAHNAPCPVCGVRCNRAKGAGLAAPLKRSRRW